MKKEVFTFQNQPWEAPRLGEMIFLLGFGGSRRSHLDVNIVTEFVPQWVAEARRNDEICSPADYRKMRLELDGKAQWLSDWQELAGTVMEACDEEPVPRIFMPEVSLTSWGWDDDSTHHHLPEAARARLEFGKFVPLKWDGGPVIEYELEAFYRSARGTREELRQGENEIADMLGDPPPHVIDESLLDEGWTLQHRGRAEFQKVLCLVPLNATDPVGCAQGMARDKLGMKEFGRCHVNGANWYDGTWEPQHGICANGRMVVLHQATEFDQKLRAIIERMPPGKIDTLNKPADE